jgi:hypothetical protein
MQKLALMMAVRMLGMPPVSNYHTDMGPREQEARGQTETVFRPFAWFESSRGTMAAEKGADPAAPYGGPPVEPGGFLVQRILQHVQLGMEGLSKIKEEIQRVGRERRESLGGKEWNPGSGGSGQVDRPKREAALKAMDALKKGADATRGRGRRKSRIYQRTGVRN